MTSSCTSYINIHVLAAGCLRMRAANYLSPWRSGLQLKVGVWFRQDTGTFDSDEQSWTSLYTGAVVRGTPACVRVRLPTSFSIATQMIVIHFCLLNPTSCTWVLKRRLYVFKCDFDGIYRLLSKQVVSNWSKLEAADSEAVIKRQTKKVFSVVLQTTALMESQ